MKKDCYETLSQFCNTLLTEVFLLIWLLQSHEIPTSLWVVSDKTFDSVCVSPMKQELWCNAETLIMFYGFLCLIYYEDPLTLN